MPVPLPPTFLTRPLAHRALHDVAHGRPENSRAAVQAAIAAGYGIEIDVQLSSDGQAMVFHDETLERLTAQSGPLNLYAAADLANIPLLGGREGIPTLPEILSLVAGQTPILIEIKDQQGQMGPTDGRLERAVAKALAGYAGDVAIMSFNPHSVAWMADISPEVPRGLTTSAYDHDDWVPLQPAVCDVLRDIPDYDRVGASFLSHEWRDLNRPRVRDLAQRGSVILCWTIKSPGEEQSARALAQNITFERYLAPVPAA